MSLRVGIHQSNFMPWLGFFDKMAKVDVWIHLNDVQFMRGEWQHRQKFHHWTKEWFWLTVPLNRATTHLHMTLKEIRIGQYNRGDWRQSHLEDLTRSYSQAPYWLRALPFLEAMYAVDWECLVDLNLYTIAALRVFLKLECPCVDARQLGDWGSRKGTDLLVWLCERIGATTYLSGPDGRFYMDLPAFERAGIEVEFQDFKHPVYPQAQGDRFVSYLSAFDLIVNHKDSDKVLRGEI